MTSKWQGFERRANKAAEATQTKMNQLNDRDEALSILKRGILKLAEDNITRATTNNQLLLAVMQKNAYLNGEMIPTRI